MDSSAAPRVLMLLRDPFVNDARVLKEGVSLIGDGYRVRVLALAERQLPRREVIEGIEVVRLASRPMNALAKLLGWRRNEATRNRQESGSTRRHWLAWGYAAASLIDGTVFALLALFEALRSDRPDIVHGHNLNVLPAAWLIARLMHARLVYDSHEIHPYSISMQKRPPLWRAWCRRAEAFFLRRADAAIAVNASAARAIARVHGVPSPLSIYNVPRLAESGGEAAVSLRAAFSGAETSSIAVYCGYLIPSRGIEESIAALSLTPGVNLALLGRGEPSYLDSLRSLAMHHGVAQQVKFVPPVHPSKVSATIREADLSLVLIQSAALSYYLSSPNKLFESLHAGLPIVAAALPEIRSVVTQYQCGLLVDQSSPEAIAEAMRRIVTDPALKRRLAEGARAAAGVLNWENEEKKLLGLYDRLTLRPARGL